MVSIGRMAEKMAEHMPQEAAAKLEGSDYGSATQKQCFWPRFSSHLYLSFLICKARNDKLIMKNEIHGEVLGIPGLSHTFNKC